MTTFYFLFILVSRADILTVTAVLGVLTLTAMTIALFQIRDKIQQLFKDVPPVESPNSKVHFKSAKQDDPYNEDGFRINCALRNLSTGAILDREVVYYPFQDGEPEFDAGFLGALKFTSAGTGNMDYHNLFIPHNRPPGSTTIPTPYKFIIEDDASNPLSPDIHDEPRRP